MLILSSCSAENELASSGGGNEILFNVEEVPFKPDSASGGAATRATKLTDISSFKLYAYDESGTAISNGVTYTKSGDSWNPDSKVFWPQTGNVTFYAFSPASNDAVVFDTQTKQLTYTAPTAQGSQQDVLYAYLLAANSGDNTATLTFNHANAAFSVNARLASGCTATVNVSGVSLVNVKPTNTLTFSDGSTSVSGDNITSALACNAKTLTTSNQAISTEPLIIPSQTITAWAGNNAISSQTGTYLAVTCNVLSNGTYVVGSSLANDTVYVPMDKALNKGEDNSVNLVFGTLDDDKRYYGRDENGNRISAAEKLIINGHEAVDLGLSVKWASMNVGASSPEESGSYFGWGATVAGQSGNSTPYYNSQYTIYSGGAILSFSENSWSKYNVKDRKTTLDLTDDAANVNWGDTWRMPTQEEIQELINKCTCTSTNYNGVNGFMVTRDGYTDSIFFPRRSYWSSQIRVHTETGYTRQSNGYSHYTYTSYDYPYMLVTHLGNSLAIQTGAGRISGLCVRPVCE